MSKIFHVEVGCMTRLAGVCGIQSRAVRNAQDGRPSDGTGPRRPTPGCVS
jgi:hypothetical protein